SRFTLKHPLQLPARPTTLLRQLFQTECSLHIGVNVIKQFANTLKRSTGTIHGWLQMRKQSGVIVAHKDN
ncbi:hypothetical protein Q0M97_15515, partial [Staphylococcus aureus]|nr:hypothetical protein [Staphylococcus aureus]